MVKKNVENRALKRRVHRPNWAKSGMWLSSFSGCWFLYWSVYRHWLWLLIHYIFFYFYFLRDFFFHSFHSSARSEKKCQERRVSSRFLNQPMVVRSLDQGRTGLCNVGFSFSCAGMCLVLSRMLSHSLWNVCVHYVQEFLAYIFF